jgi:glucose/arabinose dehydrogenase
VATGLVSPVTGAFAPGHPNHLFVVDQAGQIWDIGLGNTNGGQAPTQSLFMDLSSSLVPLGLSPTFKYDERGLLGLAFHPSFSTSGLFYTFTSQPVKGTADFSTMSINKNPFSDTLTVDLTSSRELLRIDKPYFNHNGGTLAFGKDGMLYVSLGDGGNGNDTGVGHVNGGNGQSLTPGNVLGKILRIDPQGRNSANGKYGIPPDNPFANSPTIPREIYSYGHRNPYRMSFDRNTGELYVADVGQNSLEEIDYEVAGGNYGWPIKEGTFVFAVNPTDTNILTSGYVYMNSPGYPANFIDPLANYDHSDDGGKTEARAAIIGGFVYRGYQVPALYGKYVFGDYGSGVGAPVPSGHVMTLTGSKIEVLNISGKPKDLGLFVLGFVHDFQGEIYLLGNTTGLVTGTTGQVLKLTSP